MHEAEFLIIRHPETIANTEGRWVGRGNAPFTDLGLAQVEQIAEDIAAWAPDRLFASPLDRARIPAERAAVHLGIGPILDDRLLELDFGQAEGLTFEEAAAAGVQFDFKSENAPVAQGGESRADIRLRAAGFLDEMAALGGRTAFVSHGGVFRASLVHLLGLPSDAIWAFHIRNAQRAVVRVVDGHGMLEHFAMRL